MVMSGPRAPPGTEERRRRRWCSGRPSARERGAETGGRDSGAGAGLGLGNGGKWERGCELARDGLGSRRRWKKRRGRVRVEEMSVGEARCAPLRPSSQAQHGRGVHTRRTQRMRSGASSTRRDARHMANAICDSCRCE
jgi:hypothetical protein